MSVVFPSALRRGVRGALLVMLALVGPLRYEADACGGMHCHCARTDLQAGCEACGREHDPGSVSICPFVVPAAEPSPAAPERSALDCVLPHPLDLTLLASSPVLGSPIGSHAEGRASPPLFVLHSSLLL